MYLRPEDLRAADIDVVGAIPKYGRPLTWTDAVKRKTLPSFNHQLTFGTAPRKRRGRGFIFLLVFLLVVGGASYRVFEELPLYSLIGSPPTTLPPDWQAPDVAFRAEHAPPPVRKIDIEYVVRPNDGLGQIFERLRLGGGDVAEILAAPGVGDSLRVLRPGDKLTFTLHNGVLHGLQRRLGGSTMLAIRRGEDGGFSAHTSATPVEVRTVMVRGSVDSSRFFGGRAVGLPADMAQELAEAIFAWDVDFALDIRPGDGFKVVYERKYRDGEYLGDGRIVAAELVNDGAQYRAVRYTSPDGEIDGYFTTEGRSVRRAFLRTPIDFARVSPARARDGHEIVLHTLSEHRGLDYAAPVGTAVRAAGDGRVRFAGAYGEYGTAVIVEHGGSISTLYGHLSGLAPHLQPNREVKQGEVIGYVGATGAATAPHLHYEYRVEGKATDPRKVALPPGAPIPDAYLPDFQAKLGGLVAALEGPGDTVVTALRTD